MNLQFATYAAGPSASSDDPTLFGTADEALDLSAAQRRARVAYGRLRSARELGLRAPPLVRWFDPRPAPPWILPAIGLAITIAGLLALRLAGAS